MDILSAFKNLENLLNGAIKGGLFQDANQVVGMRQSLDAVYQAVNDANDGKKGIAALVKENHLQKHADPEVKSNG